ncbi:hypothetical protein [Rhizobium halophilum]|uniref:hypothetical protein n=1 Tax=Rhizobium halophilum TaxID=2846852 RepID=UPI001EFD6C23|nr:hypothetical protein [Rhizobium halophilum]MCF6368332.1 hypothetical protein [Rhizobium halophilum]
MAEDERNQGLPEAHTPPENSGAASIEPDPERAAKVGSTRAIVQDAMTDLAQQLMGDADEAEQQSLMLDEMDEQFSLFAGPVRHVAETVSAARNGRGRPKGSQNKANQEFRDMIMKMGFRHPGLNLAALANADPVKLALEMAALPTVEGHSPEAHLAAAVQSGTLKRDQVIGLVTKAQELMLKANVELMPYFESKRPQELKVDRRVLGVMMIGEMQTQRPDDGAVMDLTKHDKPT